MTRHELAIGLWLAAWLFAGLIPAAWFAARDGNARAAGAELAAGMLGAAGFAWAGTVTW